MRTNASNDRDSLLRLQQMVKSFLASGDPSVAAANTIEAFLLETFPDDDRFEDLMIALASYQPAGGEFLYDLNSIRPVCADALFTIQSQLDR